VRCARAAGVIAAVQFVRQHDLLVSIKGGGHGVGGKAVCDGGLMIDFARMKSIRVDPTERTVRAEPGVLGAELDRETQAFGLATPVGSVSTTGIAGLTLGGGQTWLASKYGFAIDNLRSVDIVTADGTLRTASATQQEDLFWAIRGAGHNFGVVTPFEYRLHPVGPVLGGLVIHPLSQAVEVLRFYREFSASQPDELQTWAGINFYGTRVCAIDADGNEVAGVRLPPIAVAFGTYTGWNVYRAQPCELCDRDGSLIPFARTRTERDAAGDPRPSLEERYGCRDIYVARVEATAAALVTDRFLLPTDAAAYVKATNECDRF
jgi:FAD/FMN-containing dehydrogenase